MAKKIVQPVEVQATVSGDQSVKSFKAQIREAQQEALRLAAAFGETDERTLAAAKKVAQLRDQMEDLNATIAGLHPDRFQRIANITSKLASGFAAAQGAAALLGGESEDLQKSLVRIQGAMALSQGIADMKDMGKTFAGLGGDIMSKVVPAFTTLAGAAKAFMAALGIGVLIGGITMLVSLVKDLDFGLSGVSKTDKKLLKSQQDRLKASENQVKALDESDNILKAQGKSEKDILKMKIAALKVAIDNQKAVIETSKAQATAQIAAAERNRNILSGILDFISSPMNLILKIVDKIAGALGYETGLVAEFAKMKKEVVSMAFDPVETKKKADAEIKEMEAAQRQMENTLAGHQLAVKEIGKQAAEDKQKKRDEEKAKEEQAAQDAIQRDIDRLKTEEDSLANRRAIAEKEFELRKKDLEQKGYDEALMAKMLADELLKIDQEYYKQQETIRKAAEEKRKQENEKAANDELAFIQKKYDEEELAAMKAAKTQEDLQKAQTEIRKRELQNEIQARKDAGLATVEQEKELEAIRLANLKDAAEKEKTVEEAKKSVKEKIYADLMTASSAAIDIIGQETVAGKAIALAQIAADTGMAIAKALNVSQSPSPDNVASGGLAGLAKYAALSAAILSGSARAIKIVKSGNVQQGGGGSPGLGGGRVNVPMPSMNSSSLGGGTQQAGQWSNKVYVTEGDISATQRRTRNLRKTSVL
jgi:hypothetical protein